MFKHVVMWKLIKEAFGKSKDANTKEMKRILETLPDKIDEIQEYEVGINIGNSAAAFDVVLISAFDNVKDFNTYQQHPEHQKVVDFIRQIQSEAKVVDYETEE
ncbi:MAG: hypothetical protein MAGBODY4_00760 [Candidatus Marinimicrobia bacterium]|nr:hypothetical protein [Candidatus Neomarinimicrobiota bacterium]